MLHRHPRTRHRFPQHRPRVVRPRPVVVAATFYGALGLSAPELARVQEAHRHGGSIRYLCEWQGVPVTIDYAGLAAKKGGA